VESWSGYNRNDDDALGRWNDGNCSISSCAWWFQLDIVLYNMEQRHNLVLFVREVEGTE